MDPNRADEAPLVLTPNCYSANGLEPPFRAEVAERYGFRFMDLTSPDGAWTFPNDNEINDDKDMTPCDPSASKGIAYLRGVFAVVDQMIADGVVAEGQFYVSGFSQNSMFTLFMATCFQDHIAAAWQGGSGLFSSADGSHRTTVPAYRLLREQGHVPDFMIFGSDDEIEFGGHAEPINPRAWINGCLQMGPECSDRCEQRVQACMDGFKRNFRGRGGLAYDFGNPDHRDILAREFDGCLERNPDDCALGCSATVSIL